MRNLLAECWHLGRNLDVPIAQSVEQRSSKSLAEGSIPSGDAMDEIPWMCGKLIYFMDHNLMCVKPRGHDGPCDFVAHDCPDCGVQHGTCCHCGTTHGDSHSEGCPHNKWYSTRIVGEVPR